MKIGLIVPYIIGCSVGWSLGSVISRHKRERAGTEENVIAVKKLSRIINANLPDTAMIRITYTSD